MQLPDAAVEDVDVNAVSTNASITAGRPPLHASITSASTLSRVPTTPQPSHQNHSSSSSALKGHTTIVGGSPSKTVSFVESPRSSANAHQNGLGGVNAHSPLTQESVLSGGDFGWEDQSDGQSEMSGYSAYSGVSAGGGVGGPRRRGSDPEVPPKLSQNASNSFISRLTRFYKKYNEEKLSRVEEFLTAYKGEEEQLFTILVAKYGPEPPLDEEDSQLQMAGMLGSAVASGGLVKGNGSGAVSCGTDGDSADSRSDNGSMIHYSGTRRSLPKVVLASRGRTDVDTPYWPGNRLISDTDLLALLRNLRTENDELSRCYLGVLAVHPITGFNGLVYITKTPLPPTNSEELFLDHQWAGRLANNKTLVQQDMNFSRSVLHCTEDCQKHNPRLGPHERWRLTVYRGETSPLALIRMMWDAVLEQDDGPLDKDIAPIQGTLSRSSSDTGFSHHPSRKRPMEQPVQPLPSSPKSASSPTGAASSPDRGAAMEAHLQNIATAFDAKLQASLAALESRINKRLNEFNERLSALEHNR